MQRIEDILNSAIERIQRGEEISAVVSAYPQEIQELLSANLNLVKLGLTLPRATAPAPAKRKLFLQAHKPQGIFNRISSYFNLYSVALAALALIIVGVSYAAANSVPGDKLFALKRSAEIARLKLTTNPEEQAQLQLTFANARLEEAEKILADRNYSQTDAALSALNSQTEVALNNIQEIATQNPKGIKDSTLLSSVKSLADNQAQLVTKVNKDQPAAAAPQVAASTLKTVENIQKLIAASNDQASTALPSVAIDITGAITAADKTSISIDKNIYTVNADTKIIDQSGVNYKFETLQIGDSVRIQGQTQDSKNVAQTITIIKKADSAPKDTTAATTNTKTAPASTAIAPAGQTTTNQTTASPAPIKPQDTFGGFIPEAPVYPSAN